MMNAAIAGPVDSRSVNGIGGVTVADVSNSGTTIGAVANKSCN